jgi:hypothetical protein
MEHMASRLTELGFEDAAKETLDLKDTIQQSIVKAQVSKNRLEGVWKAIEWFDSADSSLEKVEEEMKKYRKE